jgi:phage recombination protein Bet
MATRLNIDPAKLLSTLKATVFKAASDDDLAALVIVSNEYELNPFLKEIYAFPAKGGGITPIVSVDGWIKMLVRQSTFDGIKFEFQDQDGRPYACTATIHVKGRTHPVEVTEYFDECKRNTDPWNNMPRRMLRNRTLCQAARMAFGFSGVVHEEETPLPSVVQIELEPKVRKLAAPVADQDPDAPKPRTPQEDLQSVVIEGGFTFSHFQSWAEGTGQIPDAGSLPDFDAVPSEVATRLLRAKSGLLKGLETDKVGAA